MTRIDTAGLIGRPIVAHGPTPKRKRVRCTEEEIERMIELHAELGNSWRGIARRMFREFGRDFDPHTIEHHVKKRRNHGTG